MTNDVTSVFSYDENCTISLTTKKSKKSPDKITGLEPVRAVIAKYGFITLPLIKRALVIKGHGSIDAEKVIEKMQSGGIIDKYTIKHPGQNMPDNDVYVLTEKEREEEKPVKIYRYDMDNIPYILEHLVQAQWHLAVTGRLNVTEVMYNHKLSLNDGGILTMPSLVKYTNLLRHKMNICAIPVCKGLHKADLGIMVKQIILINRYFAENQRKYNNNVIIVICESIHQIMEVDLLMSRIKESAGIFLLYALDIDSAMEDGKKYKDGLNPLNILYRVTQENENRQANLISIK